MKLDWSDNRHQKTWYLIIGALALIFIIGMIAIARRQDPLVALESPAAKDIGIARVIDNTATPVNAKTEEATKEPTATVSPPATNSAKLVVKTALITDTSLLTAIAQAAEWTPEPKKTRKATTSPSGKTTPTSTPTPVPRTFLANNMPDFNVANDHYWLERPFSKPYVDYASHFFPFGTNNNGEYLWHHGVDIQNPLGTPAIAVGSGIIVFAGNDKSISLGLYPNFYGNAVVIRLNRDFEGQPVFVLYGHLSKVLVETGQAVQQGDVVGLVGEEGVALGPHLHLEVRIGEIKYRKTINPELWLKPFNDFGTIAGRIIDYKGYLVPQQLVVLYRADNPNQFLRETWTYPDSEILGDPEWGESFVFGDVPVGDYIVKTYFDGRYFSLAISVGNGATTFAPIISNLPPLITTPGTPAGSLAVTATLSITGTNALTNSKIITSSSSLSEALDIEATPAE